MNLPPTWTLYCLTGAVARGEAIYDWQVLGL